jgi:predicted amino acid-binding ACT domain protein
MEMQKHMIISVMSKDRPGIIASITGAIYRLGGDVADLNQTVLCGYLTMILSASFDPEVTREDLLAAISHIKTDCRFEVSIKEPAAKRSRPGKRHRRRAISSPSRGRTRRGSSTASASSASNATSTSSTSPPVCATSSIPWPCSWICATAA